MKVTFTETALLEYISWQTEDKKTLRHINELIQSIQRDGFMKGIGKPEPLKGMKAYSRPLMPETDWFISATVSKIWLFFHAADTTKIEESPTYKQKRRPGS